MMLRNFDWKFFYFTCKIIINFKDPGNYKAALLAVACAEGHGNVSRVIKETLDSNPAILRELKKLSKKVVK